MKIRLKFNNWLKVIILLASLSCNTLSFDFHGPSSTQLQISFSSNGYGSSLVLIPFILAVQFNKFVQCTDITEGKPITVTSNSRGIASTKSQKDQDGQPKISSLSRKPRIIKELTMLNRQSCLSKILCGVEVAQPPSSKTSSMNDYAYLVKSFFDRLSIAGAVKNAVKEDEGYNESQEDDIKDENDLRRYKSHRQNGRRPHPTYKEDHFGDKELDELYEMPLEDLLDEGADFLRRRKKSHSLSPPNKNVSNITVSNQTLKSNSSSKFGFGKDSRLGSVQRGLMGFYNPRFDKTAFLNKKQLQLEQAITDQQKLQIATDIAAKLRSPRQCRLLNWFRPSYTTTTTITTTSNNPAVTNPTATVSTSSGLTALQQPLSSVSSMCPFTADELQKMILGSQQQTATEIPGAVRIQPDPLQVVAPIVPVQTKPKPYKLATKATLTPYTYTTFVPPPATPPPPTKSTTTTPRPSVVPYEYYRKPVVEENVGTVPILPGTSTYYRPEDDEKMDVFGNAHGDLVPWRFQYRPTTPAPPTRPPSTRRPPDLFDFKTAPPSRIPGPPPDFIPFHMRPRPTGNPGQYGASNGILTYRPKLPWIPPPPPSTLSPWAESAFNFNTPPYAYSPSNKSYKVKGRPGKIPMDYRLKSDLDVSDEEESSAEGDPEEGSNNHIDQNVRPRPRDTESKNSKERIDDRSEESEEDSEPRRQTVPNKEDDNSNESEEENEVKSQSRTRNKSQDNESEEDEEDNNKNEDEMKSTQKGDNDDDSEEEPEERFKHPREPKPFRPNNENDDHSAEKQKEKTENKNEKTNEPNDDDSGEEHDSDFKILKESKPFRQNQNEADDSSEEHHGPIMKSPKPIDPNEENSAEDVEESRSENSKKSKPIEPTEGENDNDSEEADGPKNQKPIQTTEDENDDDSEENQESDIKNEKPSDPNDDDSDEESESSINNPQKPKPIDPNEEDEEKPHNSNREDDSQPNDPNDDDKNDDDEENDNNSPEENNTPTNNQVDEDQNSEEEKENKSPELEDPTDIDDESEETPRPNQSPTPNKINPINRNKRGQQKPPKASEENTSTNTDPTKKDTGSSNNGGGVLKSILSNHGIRTLSRITSIFSYGSKPESPDQSHPPPPPPPPRRRRKKRPSKRPPPSQHRPYDDEEAEDSEEDDEPETKKKPKKPQQQRPQMLHPVQLPPKVIPIYVEGKESWEGEEKPHEEEFFETKTKKRKPTAKPEKYDYDEEEDSNESNASTNTQEGVDFGPGQKLHTEYSDVVSSFLRPGDRHVDHDRYVSGLPTTWENIYEEMKKEKKKAATDKKNSESEENDEVNNDDNSDESEEDERPTKGRPPHKGYGHSQRPQQHTQQHILEPID